MVMGFISAGAQHWLHRWATPRELIRSPFDKLGANGFFFK